MNTCTQWVLWIIMWHNLFFSNFNNVFWTLQSCTSINDFERILPLSPTGIKILNWVFSYDLEQIEEHINYIMDMFQTETIPHFYLIIDRTKRTKRIFTFIISNICLTALGITPKSSSVWEVILRPPIVCVLPEPYNVHINVTSSCGKCQCIKIHLLVLLMNVFLFLVWSLVCYERSLYINNIFEANLPFGHKQTL